MRAYVAAAILMALELTAAPSRQAQCKSHCDIDYNLCRQRAIGKVGRKTCAVNRANCKKGCPAVRY
jgi:hypothetical protein